MDKKKLIGTIVGVILFAALIAGATYAWLTFAASVNNGNYVAGTMEFKIEYTQGTDIEDDVPVLGSGNTADASSLNVQAYRTNASTIGTLQIKMTSKYDNLLTTSGVLEYAVCSGTETAADCDGDLSTGAEGVLSVGEINTADVPFKVTLTDTENGELHREFVLYTEENIKTAAEAENAYYWIFFWLNQADVTNEMTEDNMSFSGYIHASAQQK